MLFASFRLIERRLVSPSFLLFRRIFVPRYEDRRILTPSANGLAFIAVSLR
jgi:hypothetical protein